MDTTNGPKAGRHQVHVVLAPDDEDALAGVPVGVRVVPDVEQVATPSRSARMAGFER